jgi:hypothetical protein
MSIKHRSVGFEVEIQLCIEMEQPTAPDDLETSERTSSRALTGSRLEAICALSISRQVPLEGSRLITSSLSQLLKRSSIPASPAQLRRRLPPQSEQLTSVSMQKAQKSQPLGLSESAEVPASALTLSTG